MTDVRGDHGTSFVEVVLTLALLLVLLSSSLLATTRVREEGRVRAAASAMAGRFRWARHDAIRRSASVAVVFDNTARGWAFRMCRDGNGNGVRRADMASGVDACEEAAVVIADTFPGVVVGVDADAPGPDGDPSSADPVRFGRSNLASFSTDGTCTSGTLFLRSASGVAFAVRLAGVTGRTRLLRYDTAGRRWVDA